MGNCCSLSVDKKRRLVSSDDAVGTTATPPVRDQAVSVRAQVADCDDAEYSPHELENTCCPRMGTVVLGCKGNPAPTAVRDDKKKKQFRSVQNDIADGNPLQLPRGAGETFCSTVPPSRLQSRGRREATALREMVRPLLQSQTEVYEHVLGLRRGNRRRESEGSAGCARHYHHKNGGTVEHQQTFVTDLVDQQHNHRSQVDAASSRNSRHRGAAGQGQFSSANSSRSSSLGVPNGALVGLGPFHAAGGSSSCYSDEDVWYNNNNCAHAEPVEGPHLLVAGGLSRHHSSLSSPSGAAAAAAAPHSSSMTVPEEAKLQLQVESRTSSCSWIARSSRSSPRLALSPLGGSPVSDRPRGLLATFSPQPSS